MIDTGYQTVQSTQSCNVPMGKALTGMSFMATLSMWISSGVMHSTNIAFASMGPGLLAAGGCWWIVSDGRPCKPCACLTKTKFPCSFDLDDVEEETRIPDPETITDGGDSHPNLSSHYTEANFSTPASAQPQMV